MELIVHTYVGIGPIRFGMHRDEVRPLISCAYEAATTSFGGTTNWFDHFLSEGILVFYDAEGRCIAVEVYEPSQVILEGHPLVGFPFDEIRQWFVDRDPQFEDEDTGLLSRTYGVCLFTEDAVRCPHDRVVHAFVFQRGYYD